MSSELTIQDVFEADAIGMSSAQTTELANVIRPYLSKMSYEDFKWFLVKVTNMQIYADMTVHQAMVRAVQVMRLGKNIREGRETVKM